MRGHQDYAQADGSPCTSQTASDTNEVMWLRDILPNLIPHARIATYSYESDWRKADIKTSLRKCGEQLLNVLQQHRIQKVGRIGSRHCSSIIAQRFYRNDHLCSLDIASEVWLLSRSVWIQRETFSVLNSTQALVLADHGNTFRDIRQSTVGILFLGTPHQGSDAAVYGAWLAQVVGHDTTLLQSLRRNSGVLYDVARDFEASHNGTDTVCYYENKDASYGPLRTQVR